MISLALAATLALQTRPDPTLATPRPATRPLLAGVPLPAGPLVVTPAKTYFAPNQPFSVRVAYKVDLLLVDFIGRSTSARADDVPPGEADLHKLFKEPLGTAGTYLLLSLPHGADASRFVGTPLVITVRADNRRSAPAGPMVLRADPLQYGALSTTLGDMKVCFYHDTAPSTVVAIEQLVKDGFYDGLDFYRVEPGFIVQTGDPRGDGTGGPGFTLDAEFSDRQHLEGVLSLARMTDPNEAPGLFPRPEFANSGGSQFFVCLSYDTARQLDRRYTPFARVVDGLDVLRAISRSKLQDGTSRPQTPVKINSFRLVYATPSDNPYLHLRVVETAALTTRPSP